MKKVMTVLLAVMVLAIGGMTASAETVGAEETVYVTIADQNGDMVLVMEAVTLSDKDEDGTMTINDVLIAAHETYYKDGVSGYQTAETEYGLSMTMLWGCENGGAYGYYLRDTAAWSLMDPVKNGDRLYAFVYTDTAAWSDTYCYFDAASLNVKEGEEVTLTLKATSFDTAVGTVPVEGATLTIDGEATTFVTDAEGKVSFTLEGGNHVISAVSETMTLVPPVCKVMAAIDGSSNEGVSTTTNEVTKATTAVTVLQADSSATTEMEDNGDVLVWALVGIGVAVVVAIVGIVMIARKKK